MNDAISRAAALNTVEKMYKLCEGNLSDYHDLLVACFTDLTPAQRWIPVTERLPKAYKSVNVTVQIPEGRYVKESAFLNGDWEGVSASAEVVAWMPLPAAYQEGGKE